MVRAVASGASPLRDEQADDQESDQRPEGDDYEEEHHFNEHLRPIDDPYRCSFILHVHHTISKIRPVRSIRETYEVDFLSSPSRRHITGVKAIPR